LTVTQRWCALLAVLALAGSQNQPPQPPQPPQPTFRTEANYVRVDVFPTKDGTPVADLRQDDFEVVENGAPQKIEQFEHIVIRAAGPQETRIEPNTVAESRAMAESSRARLFVVFLDTYHVDISDSHRIRKPLIDALDRVIGQDDMVAVMTPEMSARDIVFARKTTTIDGFLTRYWHWGERNRMIPPDPEDEQYGYCYPNETKPQGSQQRDCTDQNGIAAEMIDRRHEKRSLDALQDLVRYLHGLREERKAILAITNGWLLYRPNQNLMRPLRCKGIPTGPTVGIDPRTGRLTTAETRPGVAPNASCDTDRMHLAQLDDWDQFRQMLDEANHANASFYPVDPRGLAAFDTPIMRQDVPGAAPAMVPLNVDRAMLAGRLTSLRTLAEATDGLAIVDSNDLAGGFRRVVADLSSYYLLGYYSTGKLDGKFHSITVRVKRPGVQVRARRGYLAATTAEVTAAAAASANTNAAPSAEAAAEAVAVEGALAPLPGYAREMPLRADLVAGWRRGSDGRPIPGFWVVGEFSAGTPPSRALDATILGSSGTTLARGSSESGARNVLIALAPSEPTEPGEYTVRVRGDGFGTVSVRVKLPPFDEAQGRPAPGAGGAVFIRRGQTTGNKEVPTADRRYRRSEQLRLEMPMPEAGAVTARLLDRTGKPLAVPVTVASRDDGDGTRWQTAQLALAPLAPADYIIELTSGTNRTLVGFRVVP
jgi:VWFA-related protein